MEKMIFWGWVILLDMRCGTTVEFMVKMKAGIAVKLFIEKIVL